MKSFWQYQHDAVVNFNYHVKNNIPLHDNIFRVGSEAYYNLFTEARKQMNSGKYLPEEIDKTLLETDIGTYAIYEGNNVPLDSPMISEAEYNGTEVELNEPKRGGSKKFYVYVKNEKGNVIKVEFGDTSGLSAKINNPEARASFAARHNCAEKKDKTSPGYWSCRLPYYAKQLGLSGGGSFFW